MEPPNALSRMKFSPVILEKGVEMEVVYWIALRRRVCVRTKKQPLCLTTCSGET